MTARRRAPGAGAKPRGATRATTLLTARVTAEEAAQARARAETWGWSMATLQRRALGLEPGPLVQARPDGGVTLYEAGEIAWCARPARGGWLVWRLTDPTGQPHGAGATVREAWEVAELARDP